jgi:hypothetical protein
MTRREASSRLIPFASGMRLKSPSVPRQKEASRPAGAPCSRFRVNKVTFWPVVAGLALGYG